MVTSDNIQYYLTGRHEAGITSIGDPYVGICAIMCVLFCVLYEHQGGWVSSD